MTSEGQCHWIMWKLDGSHLLSSADETAKARLEGVTF